MPREAGVRFRDLRRLAANTLQYRRRDLVCAHPPVRFWLESASACNLRCPMCPTGRLETGPSQGVMKASLFSKIVDEIVPYALDANLHFRGEPLLNQELPAMIRYASARGLRLRLETNATFLTESFSNAVLDAGLHFLSFSVDGYAAEEYEKYRAGAKFEETLAKITGFLELKKKKRMRRPLTLLQVIELPGVSESAARGGRQALRRRFQGLPLDGYRVIAPQRFAGQIPESVTGSRHAWMNKTSGVKYTPCPYPWYAFVIGWDGTVYPCCADMQGRYPLGRAGEDSILEMWNNSRMQDLRRNLREGRYGELPMCRDCDILWQKNVMGISIKNFQDVKMFMKENLLR